MKEVGTNVAKAIEISNWLLKVVNAVNRLQEEMRHPVTKIRYARLLAVAIMLRDFPDEGERKLLDQWEKHLSVFSEQIRQIGADYTIDEVSVNNCTCSVPAEVAFYPSNAPACSFSIHKNPQN